MQQSILAKYLKTNKQSATQDLLLVSDFRIIQKINQFQKVPDFALYEQGFKLQKYQTERLNLFYNKIF